MDHLASYDFEVMRRLSAIQARGRIRAGQYGGHTAGIGLGKLQGNVVILPATDAIDFFRFCQRNPKPCPLVGVSDTGDPTLPTLGDDIDIRTDVPAYRVYRHGELVSEVSDITALWQDDLVTFVIGCSFSFEDALLAAGLKLDHVARNRVVPMYRSNLNTVAAGAFQGRTVVSMRAFSEADAVKAATISANYPQAHGTPVHQGDPTIIGIDDLMKPDWGDPPALADGQIPVFWACGVTPQEALRHAKPSLCITHAPGSMLITDLKSENEK
jgi:uncharacterized protein YcsI (UPF0317 family)